MKALICLPTLNEALSIQPMIERIKKLGIDFIVSDAGSTDGTIEIAREMGAEVKLRTSPGKGVGVREILTLADERGYDVLVLIDCDETYDPENIPEMINYFPQYDMVSGARNFKGMKPLNRLANNIFILLIQIFFGYRFSDPHTGLRAIKIKQFLTTLDAVHFDLEPQLACKAVKQKMKILEIPIIYHSRSGKSKVRYQDGLLVTTMIIRERFRN